MSEPFVSDRMTGTADCASKRPGFLSMLGAVAEFERSMILERQREGVAIAKAVGKYKGRKASLSQTQASELRERLANDESVTALAANNSSQPLCQLCHGYEQPLAELRFNGGR